VDATGWPVFVSGYQKLLDECALQTPRLVLMTPPPFEKGGGWLPDLSARNPDLAEYADAIRNLARQRNLPLVDLFAELGGTTHRGPRLTDDGLSSRRAVRRTWRAHSRGSLASRTWRTPRALRTSRAFGRTLHSSVSVRWLSRRTGSGSITGVRRIWAFLAAIGPSSRAAAIIAIGHSLVPGGNGEFRAVDRGQRTRDR